MIWTVIPVKAPHRAKTRLATAIDDAARERLVMALFDHAVEIAATIAGAGQVIVVSRTAAMRARARSRGAGALDEEADAGLNGALALAAARIPREDAMLVLPIDLPYAAPADLRAMLAVAGDVIAPDRAGEGTNALLWRRAERCFHFGPASAARHRAAAPVMATFVRPGLAFDLDTPDDLAALRRDPPEWLTQAPPGAPAVQVKVGPTAAGAR